MLFKLDNIFCHLLLYKDKETGNDLIYFETSSRYDKSKVLGSIPLLFVGLFNFIAD